MDPSSALLLNSGRSGSTVIDSGRYTIRQKSELPRKEESHGSPTKKARDEDPPEPVTVVVPDAQSENQNQSQQAGVSQHPPAQPLVVRCEGFAPCVPSTQSPNPTPAIAPKEHSRRLNLMDLSLAPGYLYNNSDSGYSYRNYTYSTPTLSVDANVWLNPGFALRGSYTGTLSGHVSDATNGSKNIPAMQEWMTAGFRIRKFFGREVSAALLNFGVDYYDFQFRVPSDASLRQKLRSTGVRIAVEAEVPVSTTRAWTIGASLAPKLRHVEMATGIDFQSGGNVDANAVGVSAGGRVQFERNDAIFWKVTHTVEKDLFSGDATKADLNGTTPSGVAVTNSFTLFELGYAWGN